VDDDGTSVTSPSWPVGMEVVGDNRAGAPSETKAPVGAPVPARSPFCPVVRESWNAPRPHGSRP